ncbi:hypothetical protein P8452_05959 [Trifolium repens]|nr:hypothetical protein P8452_05959 [Trifolium repens]
MSSSLPSSPHYTADDEMSSSERRTAAVTRRSFKAVWFAFLSCNMMWTTFIKTILLIVLVYVLERMLYPRIRSRNGTSAMSVTGDLSWKTVLQFAVIIGFVVCIRIFF